MGAHLLSLRELAPALGYLAGHECRSLLLHTQMGTLMLTALERVAHQVEVALRSDPESASAQSTGSVESDLSADLSSFPGYADLGRQHQLSGERVSGVMLWSRVDIGPPIRRLGWDSALAPTAETVDIDEFGGLRSAVIAILADLRNGLRIEARHRRDVPRDLDARLFGPLDGAIKRRRERMRRTERIEASSSSEGAMEHESESRRVEPSVGAGSMGPC